MPSLSAHHYIKPGRHKRSEIDELRAKIWYLAVKRRGNWSDYKLDMQFGQAEGPISTSGEGRNRVFGVIGKKGTLPSRGDHHRRKFDLVDRVENHPQFKGTRNIIDSLLWELLQLPPLDLESTSAFVEKCLALRGLTRLHGNDAINWMKLNHGEIVQAAEPSSLISGSRAYVNSFTNTTDGLPNDLNFLALLGGLYREACLSFDLENAEGFGVYIGMSLAIFCSDPWLAPHGPYLEDLVRNRILFGKRDYIPSAVNSGIDAAFVPSERKSQGLIVALKNPKLKYITGC